MSEIESREFAESKNQPKGLQFRLMNKEGNAGVYKQGENETINTPRMLASSVYN